MSEHSAEARLDGQTPVNGDAVPCGYLVQCKGGESFRAAEHLSNQGYQVFHPVLQVQKKRRGRRRATVSPYYLFIRLDQLVSN